MSVWLFLFVSHVRDQARLPIDSRQLLLSAWFVFGCAFRSFFPRADLQRICVVDSRLSAVFWGRSVATLAELAYATQLALFFRLPVIVPVLLVAEVFSWFAILTNRALFNMLENSLWTLVALLILVARLSFAADALYVAVDLLYVIFMITTDLPMYWARHVADRQYRSVRDGLQLLLHDFHPTALDEHWREEMAWQAGYFSIFVWTSLYFVVTPVHV